MGGDEGELEAAGEEPEHQQHVAAMPEGFGQRLCDRLIGNGRGARFLGIERPGGQGQGERQDGQHAERKDDSA